MVKLRIASILIFIIGAALFVGSGLSFWRGYSAVEEWNKLDSQDRVKEEAPLGPFSVGDGIGDLVIPRLEASIPIYHGASEEELKKGIGHVANSKLPGEDGNIVLSGHRDTVFRRLGELEVGDSLYVEYGEGEYHYKIRRIRIVDADDTTVLVPKPKETLTVTTCYPFRFIGNAPERYVLEAVRIY
ncbi:sortase A [Bacillus tianshenii]|uniref:Sortase A n=1 Tax=Sutcliffiella tianshenii TaxID=1463404 RepID=A0ABS2NUT5_9BACI|nr:class D sortase [Bacillus tianshenii]MBM7618419.1 sortase A [Bacillus tianshenii]